MLTDEVKIKIRAGKGGNGVVAFDKVKMSLGPTGGRGGNGGNVYFSGVSNLSALNRFRHQKEHHAGDGKNGKTDRGDGESGKDLFLSVPIGSIIRNLATGQEIDIIEIEKPIMVAQGGFGGRGNFSFRSPINTSPEEYEEGDPGEELEIQIELRLIADIGLVGLPSAGKSSLLNELTKAGVKVGNYHFTTLEPNLGVMDKIILADIPGLIEGASSGRGLGVKFLRHIQRTKALAHCISLESENVLADYKTIRRELEKYNPDLGKKKEFIILTKTDLSSSPAIAKVVKKMQKINPDVLTVSVHNWEELEKLKEKIREIASA